MKILVFILFWLYCFLVQNQYTHIYWSNSAVISEMDSCRLLRNLSSCLTRKYSCYGSLHSLSPMIRQLHGIGVDLDDLIKERMRKQLLTDLHTTNEQRQMNVSIEPTTQASLEKVLKQDLDMDQQKKIKSNYVVTFKKSNAIASETAYKINGIISVIKSKTAPVNYRYHEKSDENLPAARSTKV